MVVYLGCESGTCSHLMVASFVVVLVDYGLVVLEGGAIELIQPAATQTVHGLEHHAWPIGIEGRSHVLACHYGE